MRDMQTICKQDAVGLQSFCRINAKEMQTPKLVPMLECPYLCPRNHNPEITNLIKRKDYDKENVDGSGCHDDVGNHLDGSECESR